jgi:hypothetical protein
MINAQCAEKEHVEQKDYSNVLGLEEREIL